MAMGEGEMYDKDMLMMNDTRQPLSWCDDFLTCSHHLLALVVAEDTMAVHTTLWE